MAEYIRKQAALAAFGLSDKTRKYGGDHSGYDTRMLYEIQDTLEGLPAEDVRPVRHGHWVYGEDKYGIDGYHCNKCGFFVPWDYTHKFINFIEDYHYCPHCDAKMVKYTGMKGAEDG